MKIVITGAAGLVGQNLIILLKERGYHGSSLLAIDRHEHNLATLSHLHPDVQCLHADLAVPGPWQEAFTGADAAVILHARIRSTNPLDFTHDNLDATGQLIEALHHHHVPYLVHVSSSMCTTALDDPYTVTKKAQEELIASCGIPHAILRPTIMFGCFDRKHFGWLARFMRKSPLFPLPGSGEYARQPLYVRDFCAIIASCLEHLLSGTYNISGLETLTYAEIIRRLRGITHAHSLLLPIPVSAFRLMLKAAALILSNPPFTVEQLNSVITSDTFELIDWPEIFGISATPFEEALKQTFTDPRFTDIVLENN